MNYANKTLIMLSAVLLTAMMHNAHADLRADADVIFNWGENKFPGLLTPRDTTKTLDVYLYRHYPASGIYAGVNTQDSNVYLLGGIFGNSPVLFKSVRETLDLIAKEGAESGANCDAAKAPPGVSYRQEGDRLKITTNGQCVALPASAICVPPVANASGISVLSTNDVKEFSFEGIKWSDPQLESAFTPTIRDAINAKTCLVNASQSFVNQITDTDVCFDVSNQLSDLKNLQGLVTVTPPVNMRMQSTVVNSIVPDCFTTDASIVTDAFTNQVWVKQDGRFVEVK